MNTKEVVQILLFAGLLALVYFTIDAITTKNPNRRVRDLRDLRIVGAGMNVIKSV